MVIDILNRFGVTCGADNSIVLLIPPRGNVPIPQADAVALACWILVMSGVDQSTLAMTLARIEDS